VPDKVKGDNMAKYVQGTAPAVLFEGDNVVWAFRGGNLAIKDEIAFCNENRLHNRLLAAGAVYIEDIKEQ
jgi:hypothetical protein